MNNRAAYYLAHGFAVIAETCDVRVIDAAIKQLTKLSNRLKALKDNNGHTNA